MRKYRFLFKSYLLTMMEYRGIPVAWALIEIVALFSSVFLWIAVYADKKFVGNYDFGQMIFYYAFIPLIGSLTEVYVASSLPKVIKDGRISADLLKPLSISACYFVRTLSVKVAQQILKIPIFLFSIVIIFSFFKLNIDPVRIVLCLFFCLFALVLNFLIDLSLSYAAFWIDDVWALKHLKIVMLLVFGGMAFPLDLASGTIKSIFYFLPFKFVYFIPISIAKGMDFPSLINNFLQLFVWILFFVLISKILWRFGIKKYGAYGN